MTARINRYEAIRNHFETEVNSCWFVNIIKKQQRRV